MKYMCAFIVFLFMWVNLAWAVQTHKISPDERQSLPWWSNERPIRTEVVANPWWDKNKPVRPAVVERPWWDKNRIVRPPSAIEAERANKYANYRGKQKTSDNVKLAIKLDKMDD